MNCAFIILLTHWNTAGGNICGLSHLLLFFLFWQCSFCGGLEEVGAEVIKQNKWERVGGVSTRSIPLGVPGDECTARCCWACWGAPFINHQLLRGGHDTEAEGNRFDYCHILKDSCDWRLLFLKALGFYCCDCKWRTFGRNTFFIRHRCFCLVFFRSIFSIEGRDLFFSLSTHAMKRTNKNKCVLTTSAVWKAKPHSFVT